jgi:processive 1,2-diacylglycerol beta-glucosyltransferase
MIRKNLPAEKIIDTGFPVNPVFSELTPVDAGRPLRPLPRPLFPHRQTPLRPPPRPRPAGRLARVSSPSCSAATSAASIPAPAKLKDAYPGRVRIIGWTRRVPQLLNSHHLVVGKAGGATVHEAIAARCPMLIHHLVPGQEEGNLRLLEPSAAARSPTPRQLMSRQVSDLLADHAAGWRSMKHALARHGRNAGAIAAAFILKPADRGSYPNPIQI